MRSWDLIRRLVEFVGILVIFALIASASLQWWRGNRRAGGLIPGLTGIILGGTILLLNNYGLMPKGAYTQARWLGLIVLFVGAIALWRK